MGGVDVAELGTVEIFAAVEPAQLEALADTSYVRRLARGQLLFDEGEPSEHLYLLRSGRLKVFLGSAQGVELMLTVVHPGEVVGELSALDGRPRSASVEALDAVELAVLPVEEVRRVLLASPAALLAVAGELAATVRRLTGASGDLVFLDLPRRLAKLVLTHDGGTLDLTQSELASMLGVTRQSLNRALVALQRRGWIRAESRALHVVDRGALERFAAS